MNLPTKLLTDGATIPTYGSTEAAGMDLYADFSNQPGNVFRLDPGERWAVPTGIAVALPPMHYGRVAPRSGLAFKSGIDVLAGVVDSDYRGEIRAILVNLGSEPFLIQHGDRVAQMIVTPYEQTAPYVVEDLEDTERDSGGFGSTGK